MEYVWFALVVAGCAVAGWLAYRMEPHWASKNGRRFICTAQLLDSKGQPLTKWRETRVILGTSNQAQVDQKRMMRRTTTFWRVARRSDDPPRGKEIFLLDGFDENGAPAMLALRMPKKSRAVEPLIEAMAKR